jgi:hypothetical protein
LDIAAICFNCFELVTIIVEAGRCERAAPNPALRLMERAAVMVLINVCLFVKDSSTLILAIGPILAAIGCLKIYYLTKAISAFYQKEEVDERDQKS